LTLTTTIVEEYSSIVYIFFVWSAEVDLLGYTFHLIHNATKQPIQPNTFCIIGGTIMQANFTVFTPTNFF